MQYFALFSQLALVNFRPMSKYRGVCVSSLSASCSKCSSFVLGASDDNFNISFMFYIIFLYIVKKSYMYIPPISRCDVCLHFIDDIDIA